MNTHTMLAVITGALAVLLVVGAVVMLATGMKLIYPIIWLALAAANAVMCGLNLSARS